MEDYKQLIFLPARENLIKYHDEREEVIRTCRDINSYSKKLIFSCHRISDSNINDAIQNQIDSYLAILGNKLHYIDSIADSCNFSNYKSTISNAIEEMIEGLTFLYYVVQGKLMSYGQLLSVVQQLINKTGKSCRELIVEELPPYTESRFIFEGDYFMGLFDLTGEIMRYSISNPIDEDTKTISPQVVRNLQFLQQTYRYLCDLFIVYPNLNINRGAFNIDFNSKGCGTIKKKMEVFKQSLDKVHAMVCDISIRSKEFPGIVQPQEFYT